MVSPRSWSQRNESAGKLRGEGVLWRRRRAEGVSSARTFIIPRHPLPFPQKPFRNVEAVAQGLKPRGKGKRFRRSDLSRCAQALDMLSPSLHPTGTNQKAIQTKTTFNCDGERNGNSKTPWEGREENKTRILSFESALVCLLLFIYKSKVCYLKVIK